MLTFDGCGCGRSCSWDYFAKNVAQETKELCSCWDKTKRHFEIVNDTSQQRNVLVKVVCTAEGCSQSFSESTKVLTRKFLEFYELQDLDVT